MNSFAQPQAPVPVQQAPAPMQPAPWHSDVTSNFQTAYQTFNPVAADLHSGAVVPTPHPDYGNPNVSYAAPQQVQPQTAVAGRYSYAGGGSVAPQQQETQPTPVPIYGPPAPNFTPYGGGDSTGVQSYGNVNPNAQPQPSGNYPTPQFHPGDYEIHNPLPMDLPPQYTNSSEIHGPLSGSVYDPAPIAPFYPSYDSKYPVSNPSNYGGFNSPEYFYPGNPNTGNGGGE